ncbi:MAG TPA: ribose-5-phosphate isomerase RpiA [Gemmatimonadaceae bacterium]|nr:ribose-5-phosphate isomerase RpiA [Gemmatimonadaceae bacterium]
MSSGDPAVDAVAARAIELIVDGARVGLGSGRTASAFIRLLGARVSAGLRVTGVPTSGAVAVIAREVGIPLIALSETEMLDITVDGADEVAPNLDLIKGHGGALLRERIVAAASTRQVILVGAEKLVKQLGERFAIPVEVFPFAEGPVCRAIRHAGLDPHARMDADGGAALVNENGNLTFDCALPAPLADARAARALESLLRAIPGVVDTGLFLGTAERVLVGHADGRVDTLVREGAR